MRRWTLTTATALALAALPAAASAATLTGRAVLPAATFAPGPVSGTLIASANGFTPPFLAGQPVQGFSGALDRGDGTFTAMPDNGFGAKGNSGDFLLRWYTVRPDLRTAGGGTGGVAVEDYVEIRDPKRRMGFPIRNETAIGRPLTGADLDIESIQRTDDGSYWIGDEFGPFVVHVSADGRLLNPPIPTPGVQSDSNPFIPAGTGNLPNSKGFEGMALAPGGRYLYPMLEGALKTDAEPVLRIFQLDTRTRAYTGRVWRYRLESAGNALGDLQMINDHQMILIERDGTQGNLAGFKRLYLLDLDRVDAAGNVQKTMLVDLMRIADPAGISTAAPAPRPGDIGLGNPFAMPFVTIEDVVVLAADELLVANDNNFPFSAGRNPVIPGVQPGRADDNEIIRIRLDEPLDVAPVVLLRPPLQTAREALLDAARRALAGEADDAVAATEDARDLIRRGRGLAVELLGGGRRIEALVRLAAADLLARRATTLVEDEPEVAAGLLAAARRHVGAVLTAAR